jgi:hypothetical protein
MATSFIILHSLQNKSFLYNSYTSIFLSARNESRLLNPLFLKAIFPHSTEQKKMALFQVRSQVHRSSNEIHHEGLKLGNIWENGAERKWRLAVWT